MDRTGQDDYVRCVRAARAQALYAAGYTTLGGLVVVFILAHYIPMYFILLQALNSHMEQVFNTAFRDPKTPYAALMRFQHAQAMALYMPLALLSIPLLDFAMTILPLVTLWHRLTRPREKQSKEQKAKSGPSYVLRDLKEFAEQYEKIRLPVECFLESVPQTILQVYMFVNLRHSENAQGLDVSADVRRRPAIATY